MPFVGEIFAQLKAAGSTPVLQEIRDGQITAVTGTELLELVQRARSFLASKSLTKGERCGLLAPNSMRWIAMDLAATAEGLIVVPLYCRQAPHELIAMMKDSTPALVCCGDATLREGIQQNWSARRRILSSTRSSRELTEFRWTVRRCAAKIRSPSFTPPVHRVSQGCGAHCGQRRLHARMYFGSSGPVDGRTHLARSHFSLPAIQLLRVMDRGADLHVARKPGHAQYRPDENTQ